jgi:hypothetical protein
LQHLPEGKLLFVLDYSTIHETARFKLKCLNFTLFWNEDGIYRMRMRGRKRKKERNKIKKRK